MLQQGSGEPTTPRLPPPARPETLLLIAKWTGHTNTAPRGKRKDLKHLYRLAIRPDEPITIGRRVRILAIAPITYSVPDVPTNEYDTYDPHVTGVITAVWRSEDGAGNARVTNICRSNEVREVELHFPPECGRARGAEGRAERANESDTVPKDFKADLDIIACIRPMPVWRECLGEMCWNFRRDLRF